MATNQMEEMQILKARDKALIESLNDLTHYALAVPDYGYHWIDKKYRRDWFISSKN